MSHFCVYVFHDKNTSIDTLLAPYDENLVVEPYVEYNKEEAIAKVRKEINDYKNGEYAEYIKNPEITRQRMFYEAMEEVLPDLKVIIESPNGDVQTIYPIESFTGSSNTAGSSNNSVSSENSAENN